MAAEPLTFYPAYTFSASPTYFAWVKLTAHDIRHVLRSRPGFAASTGNSRSELLFYLNHPIQFIQIVGVVVAYEEYFEKFWSFTVDDGSGEVCECVAWKPDERVKDAVDGTGAATPKVDIEQQKREQTITGLDIGMVVQVKGMVSTFHEIRRLQIERLSVVPTTNHEVRLIAARTKFLEVVLMKSWVISPKRQRQLLEEAQGEVKKDSEKAAKLRERAKKMEEREKRHAGRIARDYEVEEEERRNDAEEAKKAGMDLQEQNSHKIVEQDDFAELTY